MDDDRVRAAAQRFVATYGRAATLAATAPGRVNLMGDHTDYADGLAMPCAIDLHTVAVAALRPATHAETRVCSMQSGQEIIQLPPTIEEDPRGDWADYLRGVRYGYGQGGFAVPAMDVLIGGNLPLGAGLSSSASLELCYANLLEQAMGVSLDVRARALLCQQAEHRFAGVPCGVLDQFAVSFAKAGQAMILDCRSLEIEQTPIGEGVELVVVDSRVRHELADGTYARRRQEVATAASALGGSLRDASLPDLLELDSPELRARAGHVISENQRVRRFAAALQSEDWAKGGEIMLESHASLRDDFEVSCPEVDWLVARSVEAGVYGARMTGGGFGGSVVCLASVMAAEGLEQALARDYSRAFGRDCGVRHVRSVGGAVSWSLGASV